jgi:hypothetical protein
MIKGWNKKHSKLFRSFHLEALMLKILTNVTITDFPSGARYFFDKARVQVRYWIPDPAGYKNNIGDYLSSSDLDAIVSRLETAYSRACEAESLEAVGKTSQAFEKWRLIFDDYFPAYG